VVAVVVVCCAVPAHKRKQVHQRRTGAPHACPMKYPAKPESQIWRGAGREGMEEPQLKVMTRQAPNTS
jgi:hypothetical protein